MNADQEMQKKDHPMQQAVSNRLISSLLFLEAEITNQQLFDYLKRSVVCRVAADIEKKKIAPNLREEFLGNGFGQLISELYVFTPDELESLLRYAKDYFASYAVADFVDFVELAIKHEGAEKNEK